MAPWYAVNARDLLEARRHGKMPARPVVVSTIGGEFGRIADATLYVHEDTPIERLSWQMLPNLEVWLWVDGTIPVGRVLDLLDGIAQVRPRRLCLRFDCPWSWVSPGGHEFAAETHDVHIGTGIHLESVRDLPAVHEFCWTPAALSPTPIEWRLRDAALTRHQWGKTL
jgi:hypothetical protein